MPLTPSAGCGPPVLDFSGSRADGWPVSTPDGVVARMDVGWGRTATARFAAGRECEVRGEFFSRAWEMTDGTGRIVARSVPTSSSWGFRPDAWLVQQDGSLTLTQFVAVVQTYRRIVQRRRAAAASA